ncbi:hypothetical protein CIB84_017682, partial [Bambusicola thoracicus]
DLTTPKLPLDSHLEVAPNPTSSPGVGAGEAAATRTGRTTHSSGKEETEKITGCWDIPSKPRCAEPFLQPIIHLLLVASKLPLVLEMCTQLPEPTVLRAEICWLW